MKRGQPRIDIREPATCACCAEPVFQARVATTVTILLEPDHFDGSSYRFRRHRCHPPALKRYAVNG